MKTTKNIARIAVTAGLTAALSFGGVIAPVTMAFAEGGSTVTFEDPSYSTTTTYKGIQIFAANVSGSTATNIQWAGTDATQKGNIQTAVVQAINSWSVANGKSPYSSTNAQDAAEWLNENANVSGEDPRVANDSVLNQIAKNLSAEGFTWKTTEKGSYTLDGLDAGYWLFLTASVNKPDEGSAASQSTDAFTSPIFKLVNGTDSVNITPKKKIPTVEKKIVSDKNGKECDAADSQIGQNVTYNLYGTVADNYDTYDTYYYQFSDHISKGLMLQDGAQVYLYESKEAAQGDLKREGAALNITGSFKKENGAVDENGSKTITWTCDNLKNISGATITKDSCIVVSYAARINKEAVVGLANNKEGNPNTVTLYYSNNPMTTEHGQTVPDTVRDYTYGLKINKVDLGTEKALDGAKFTIQATGVDDVASDNLYVQDDGSLGENPCYFTTTSGVIKVTGLDAGKYTVTETSAPDGYTAVAPFTFEIKPNMNGDDPNAGLTDLTHVLNTNNQEGKVIAGLTDKDAGDNMLKAKTNSEIDDEGYYNITVGNTKQINLPLTGLNGVTFTWIAGGAVLCIGVAHLIRSRKRDEGSEE